jgi:hypothetical protein
VNLDFSKDFNTVPHERLLAELRAKGIGVEVCYWSEIWSLKRKQRIRTREVLSEEGEVGSGVP